MFFDDEDTRFVDNKTYKLRKKERSITLSNLSDSSVKVDQLVQRYYYESTRLLVDIKTGALKVRGILSEVTGIVKQLSINKNKLRPYKVLCQKMSQGYTQLFPLA